MAFKDYFTKTASEYGKFRPHYPVALFEWLASQSPGTATAWDCATGSGQAAEGLSSFFRFVAATDGSEKQLRNAAPNPKVSYMAGLAETAPLKSGSIDLATVAQAAHWFDLKKFYAEAQRVLKPGGLLALWCYSLLRIDPGVDAIIDALYTDITGPYWPRGREMVDDHYRSINFPFEEISAPDYRMEAEWNLAHLLGYLGTWSAVGRFAQERGFDPLGLVRDDLKTAWGNPDIAKKVYWPIHMRVAKMQEKDAKVERT